jgi:hypothetical protein
VLELTFSEAQGQPAYGKDGKAEVFAISVIQGYDSTTLGYIENRCNERESMRLKAAIILLFFLLAVTTAFPIQQSASSQRVSNGDYNRSLKLFGVAYSDAQSTQAAPPSTPGTLDEHFEARRQNFKSGREMLLDKGVTFEPEELLRDHRSKAIQDALDAMPEMHQSRYETAPLTGVYMADTLYLPEKVQLSGHTIIIANYVVFEGTSPIIKGHYDLYFFPSKPVAVLGTTLAQTLHKKSALLSVKLQGRRVLPSFALMQNIGDRGKHQITFDTSGPEPQALRPLPRKTPARLSTASWNGMPYAILPPQTCNTGCDLTGSTGNNGTSGTPGLQGTTGASPQKAPNGNCSTPDTGSNNGSLGTRGGDGGTGQNGGNGGQGGPGGNAAIINAIVGDGDTNQYNFIADGGIGGLGGEGGNGGSGGSGGRGGDGGDGVACSCQLGEGGDAAHGGDGATGGNGGIGGTGGTGGNGATITVSLPFNSPGATTSNSGGRGGLAGSGGIGGAGGNAGLAGNPGIGATACNQTGAGGSLAFPGASGGGSTSGNAGANGASGLAGPAPSIAFRSPPPPPPPPTGCSAPPGSHFRSDQTGDDTDLSNCSPIIIDVTGDGFFLTSAADGVKFDIANTGVPIQIAWTANSNNAFLVLDRNGNGIINSGAELFGNFTPQPTSARPNGFLALAQYDTNGDGVIDAKDPIYSQLRLWVDANHDGISQPGELHTLPEMGVFSISLDYSLSMRTDEFGNVFRYKAKINQGLNGASDAGKKAYDVFFVTQ